VITKSEWDALTNEQQMIVARKAHVELVGVVKIALDEYLKGEGDGFPAFSFLTALAEIAAIGVPDDEPSRTEMTRMFIRYFEEAVREG